MAKIIPLKDRKPHVIYPLKDYLLGDELRIYTYCGFINQPDGKPLGIHAQYIFDALQTLTKNNEIGYISCYKLQSRLHISQKTVNRTLKKLAVVFNIKVFYSKGNRQHIVQVGRTADFDKIMAKALEQDEILLQKLSLNPPISVRK